VDTIKPSYQVLLPGSVVAMASFQDGVMVGLDNKEVWRIDGNEPPLIWYTTEHLEGPIHRIVVSPFDDLVTCSTRGYVTFLSAQMETAYQEFRGVGPVSVAFSPDGRHLAAAFQKTVRLWPYYQHGKLGTKIHLVGDGAAVVGMAFNSRNFFALDANGVLRRFRTSDGSLLSVTKSGKRSTSFVQINDRLFAFGGLSSVHLLIHRRRRRTVDFVEGEKCASTITAMASTHCKIMTGHADGTVTIWVALTLARWSAFQAHDGPVTAMTITADGELVTGDKAGYVKFWRLP